jgi:hypothetical protein
MAGIDAIFFVEDDEDLVEVVRSESLKILWKLRTLYLSRVQYSILGPSSFVMVLAW